MSQSENTGNIRTELTLTEEEANAYSQFLKRIAFADYRSLSTSEREAYLMQYAGTRVREALAKLGFSPR